MEKIQRYFTSFIPTFLFLIAAGLSGCSSNPYALHKGNAFSTSTYSASASPEYNHRALAIAHEMIGTPYRYGGADPRGFDCSGLVYYAYRKAGMQISRTTSDQFQQTRRVHLAELRPGDLVFFNVSRDKPSHVGIYAGQGRFIHAPSRNKQVSYALLDDFYWKDKLIGTGRL